MTTQADQPMSWQDQLLDVLTARARTWMVVAVLLILLAALLALLAPGTLPPRPLVGFAVGLAAVLLATAVVIGLDVSDVIVRGRRHVENAGGHVAGTISRATSDIDALVELIDAHAQDGKVRVALTPASRSAGVPGSRANIVATELAGRGAKVLVTDLTRGGTPAMGLSDVISGERTLGEAVRFDDELYLAHLAVGSEPELALEGFSEWSRGLPPDLDVLVAALPPLSEPGVLPAVDGVELVLLLVEVGRTERVDLIASLDAIDAADVPAELVLVDDEAVVAPRTGSGSVEVLSTPGSSPRQRDPDGFDLHDEGGPPPPVDADPGVDTDADEDAAASTTVDSTAATGAATHPGADTTTGASGLGAGAAAVAGGMAGAAAAGAAAGDADLRARRADAGDERDLDEFEDPDDAVTEPGGGHVRTVRRRPAGPPDDTMALPPEEIPGAGAPLGEHTMSEVPEHVAPADDEAARPVASTGPHDPAPTEALDPVARPDAAMGTEAYAVPDTGAASSDDAPRPPMSFAPSPVEEPLAAPDAGPDADAAGALDEGPPTAATTVDHDHALDGDTADPSVDEPDDEDPIDVVAREQQRLAASLQQLAQDVWRRGDGE